MRAFTDYNARRAALQGVVDGRTNTQAQSVLNQGLDRGMRQNLSMAASGRGNRNLALRNAMVQNAQSQADARQQAAGIAAQESSMARQEMRAYDQMNDDLAQKEKEEKNRLIASILSGVAGAAGGALALSDERTKEDVTIGDEDVQRFLDTLKSVSFRYKSGGKRHTGVMAQNVERAEKAANVPKETMVVEGEDGMKRVGPNKPGETFSLVLSSLAQMNKRLKKVEGK